MDFASAQVIGAGLAAIGVGAAAIRGMVPKIQSTVELREKTIADDLAAAQQARESAEETEAAYRAKIDASRAQAATVTQEARQASARETEAKVRAAAEKIAAKVASAEADIRAAALSARTEVEAAAIDATQEMVAKLTGIQVERPQAAAAVKAEYHG
jgi:F-type H+-transporting ATPase subunit b